MIPGSATGSTLRVEHIWGTAITFDCRDPLPNDAGDEVFQWFRRVDDLFSTWRVDSEISRLARGELARGDLSVETRTVLDLCDDVMVETHGAFDIHVGADPRVAPREGLGRIDPSGMVKGWALDRAAERLEAHGVSNFMLNAGGDVVVRGRPAPAEQWRVGIQHPWRRDKVAAVVEVEDQAVATSGCYELGDHIIDPRTGKPAQGLVAVTIIGDDAALADARATAAMVRGRDGLDELANAGIAAMAIGDDARVTVTEPFSRVRVG